MSRTRFRVNPHFLVAWMSRNCLLERGAKSEVQVTATGLEPTTTLFVYQLRQFTFSSWWVIILIATVRTFKRIKNLKLIIIGYWVIRTAWKLKKSLDVGSSLQSQKKKELGMFVVSDTNISPSFILIQNRIQEKY